MFLSFFNVSVFSYVDLFWYLVQYVHGILLRHFIPDVYLRRPSVTENAAPSEP